jgi:hypothetical protein
VRTKSCVWASKFMGKEQLKFKAMHALVLFQALQLRCSVVCRQR